MTQEQQQRAIRELSARRRQLITAGHDAAESRRGALADREVLLAFSDGSVRRAVLAPSAVARAELALQRRPTASPAAPVALIRGGAQ